MAYSTPITAVANATFTAAQFNASVRDNILETPAAKFTAAGQMMISSAANAGAIRTPSFARTGPALQTTTSTTPADLTTAGPIISTLSTGASAIWVVSSYCASSVAGAGAYMCCAVSGASTIAGDLLRSLRVISETAASNQKMSYVGTFNTTLTPGSNTFTAKYASTSGASTAGFDERELIVFPL